MKNKKKTVSTPRDPHFVALTKRKQGAHGKSTKALRKGFKMSFKKSLESL